MTVEREERQAGRADRHTHRGRETGQTESQTNRQTGVRIDCIEYGHTKPGHTISCHTSIARYYIYITCNWIVLRLRPYAADPGASDTQARQGIP